MRRSLFLLAPTLLSLLAAHATAAEFNGQKAFEYTRDVVAFGPREPGTEAHRKTEAFIAAHLRRDHARIWNDRFTAHTPKGPLPEDNIVAKFGPAGGPVLMVVGHYDTKFLPHFVGANDGGSSTGFLLEMADLLAQDPPKTAVWLGFLDGEEAVGPWSATDGDYGSRQLAHYFAGHGIAPRVRALLLVDMIGDRDLDITRETNSTAWLNDFVAAAARKTGEQRYFFHRRDAIEDDHTPFLAVGIPSVDLIDVTYGPNNSGPPFGPYWHTSQDTMDKLSPHSFQVVGTVVVKTLSLLEAQ